MPPYFMLNFPLPLTPSRRKSASYRNVAMFFKFKIPISPPLVLLVNGCGYIANSSTFAKYWLVGGILNLSCSK